MTRMNTDKDKHHGNQRMIEAQRTQRGATATETERGHSCPQQRPDAEPVQKLLTPSCHSTLLRTGMCALGFGGRDEREIGMNGLTSIAMVVVIGIIGAF